MKTGWIGVDLDGTLAHYDGWVGPRAIGTPIPAMVGRIRAWLAEGLEVRIFTARVGPQKDINDVVRAREAIEEWCVDHIGQVLPVTATKDFAMSELWDDRCKQVVPNTGLCLEQLLQKAGEVFDNLPEELPPAAAQAIEEFNRLLKVARV